MLSGDESGSSDPFVKVFFYGKSAQSRILDDTCNPIWNQRLELDALIFDEFNSPPILIKVYDKDPGSKEALGSVLIDITEGIAKGHVNFFKKTEEKKYVEPKPEWLNVNYGNSHELNAGKILLSVSFFEERPLEVLHEIRLDTKKYQVNLKILKVSGLESLGIIPVKRPFIKFDINSLRLPQEKSVLTEKRFI